jgi:hypothetical protein
MEEQTGMYFNNQEYEVKGESGKEMVFLENCIVRGWGY